MSLLAITVFIIFLIPVSIYKLGYEAKVPLIKHKFSFPLELYRFYSKILIIIVFLACVYHLLSYELNYNFIDSLLGINGKADAAAFSLQKIINLPTLIFFILLYILSFLWGYCDSHTKQNSLKEYIKKETPLFRLRDISLFGLWSAIIYSNENNVEINIDVLTDGDLLYSGELYHFELGESGLNTITLKNTKRFLVPITDVKGKNEKKYTIPGEFTHFIGSKIKNINLKSIIESKDDYVFWGENILFDDTKFKEELKKVMVEVVSDTMKKPKKSNKSENKKTPVNSQKK